MLVPLLEGAYTARSIIANAQRCINLFPEKNSADAPVPATHYTTPGLTATGFAASAPCRGEYLATNGNLYSVYGNSSGSSLYVSTPVTSGQGIATTTLIGTFASTGSNMVSMQDNGIVLLIVDNTSSGWCLDLTNSANFAQITDPNFVGATRIQFVDTYFIFNVPNTNRWYISISEADFSMFCGTTGAIISGSITGPGSTNYTNGTFTNQTLSGGTGTGAVGTITVAGNIIADVTITSPGINYAIGDTLTATLPGSGVSNGTITGGTGYTNGTYSGYILSGGSGSGASANITVSGNTVTAVVISTGGLGYVVGDVLSAAIPGGSSFVYTVTAVTGTDFIYTVETIGGEAIDPQDFAAKTTYSDPISTLAVVNLFIWIIGTQTTEIWYNAGAADFTFGIFPGVFIEHGCAAPYSVAQQDLSVYWLSKDKQGQCIVVKGTNFAAHRISTFAIENELSKYSTVSDAIGLIYQQNGHVFYVLTFPTADKTWVFDEAAGLWHERNSIQTIINNAYVTDGNLHKVLYNSCAVCGGLIYVADYLGNQYQLDINNYTENGVQIPRIRSFMHMVNGQNRVAYRKFIADMECGTDDPTMTSDGTSPASPPTVSLRWSDDRGKTFGNKVEQSLGALGQYLTSLQWQRLGYARDRVFELSWSAPTKTALNAAWVDSTPAGS